ncbi:hypothetical protein V5O48_008380, partial [Marasmius crinis-equi]
MKEVLLVGLGGVGATYALLLKEAGRCRVNVVARSNFEIVNQRGLTFRDTESQTTLNEWRPDRLFRTVSEAAGIDYDYVFLATKAVPEVCRSEEILLPLLSRNYAKPPVYVLLQNGIGIERGLFEALSHGTKGTIVSAAVHCLANLVEPAVVEYVESHRKLVLGTYHGQEQTMAAAEGISPEDKQLLDDVKNLFDPGRVEVSLTPNIQSRKMEKNLVNLALVTFFTLVNQTGPAIFRPPPKPEASEYYEPYVFPQTAHLIEEYTIPNIKAVMHEAIEVAHAAGMNMPDNIDDTTIELARGLYSDPRNTFVASMHLDAQKGNPIEVEVIIGEVVRLAERVGVQVPSHLEADGDDLFHAAGSTESDPEEAGRAQTS